MLKQGLLPFRYEYEPTQSGIDGVGWLTGLSGTGHSLRTTGGQSNVIWVPVI